MRNQAFPQERREVLMTARRYRRDGYKVSAADEVRARLSFLGDLVPDLVAERDDDKVVIEVKRTKTVRGSNDIVQLAERVAAQPGWRFELVAVPSAVQIATPDLKGGSEDVVCLLEKGLLKPAFVVAFAMLENIVAYASVRQNANPANQAFPVAVRALVVRGVISEDMRQAIEDARATRNGLMHVGTDAVPTKNEVEALLALGADLQREVLSHSP